jgi:hypothetical protein
MDDLHVTPSYSTVSSLWKTLFLVHSLDGHRGKLKLIKSAITRDTHQSTACLAIKIVACRRKQTKRKKRSLTPALSCGRSSSVLFGLEGTG